LVAFASVSPWQDPSAREAHYWLVYQESGSANVRYRSFSPHGAWGLQRTAGSGNGLFSSSVGSLAATAFRGRLHVAAQHYVGNSLRIWQASCRDPVGEPSTCDSGAVWTMGVATDEGELPTNAVDLDAAGALDGRLYLWHHVQNVPTALWRFKEGE